MTWIKTVPESEATGLLAEVYRDMRERRGRVLNIAKAASINPPVMQALDQLNHALRGPDCALGEHRQEMIAVLTSALHQCTY